jgi:protein TonB
MNKILPLFLLLFATTSNAITLIAPVIEVSPKTERYYAEIEQRIKWYKRYPLIAQVKGMQGDVVLEVTFDEKGKVIASTINKSSGNEYLDQGGLDTIENAAPFPTPPTELLESNKLTVHVPIYFRLSMVGSKFLPHIPLQ